MSQSCVPAEQRTSLNNTAIIHFYIKETYRWPIKKLLAGRNTF